MKIHAKHLIQKAQRTPEFWIEPDAFLRYLPAIEWIKTQKLPVRILEVGSGDFGLSTYIRYPVVKVDLRFERPPQTNARKVVGTALKLPFQDGWFDLVFSADLFEHVAPDARWQILSEMVRVSKGEAIAVFPCGERSRFQDLKIAKRFKGVEGRELNILQAHEEVPFPSEKEISAWLEDFKDEIEKWQISNSFNRTLREILTTGWLKQNGLAIGFAYLILKFPWISKQEKGTGLPATKSFDRLRMLSEVEARGGSATRFSAGGRISPLAEAESNDLSPFAVPGQEDVTCSLFFHQALRFLKRTATNARSVKAVRR